MHSFYSFIDPRTFQSLLWVQVVGMPIAFLVRATVLFVRAHREDQSRLKHTIRAVSNILFAASCWTFSVSWQLAAACFATGVGISIWAFTIARAQAIKCSPAVKVVPRRRSKPALTAKRAR